MYYQYTDDSKLRFLVLCQWSEVSQVLVPVSGGCLVWMGGQTLAQSWLHVAWLHISDCGEISFLVWEGVALHHTRLVHNQQVAAVIKMAFVQVYLVWQWPLFDQEALQTITCALVLPHECVTITQFTWGCPFFFFIYYFYGLSWFFVYFLKIVIVSNQT